MKVVEKVQTLCAGSKYDMCSAGRSRRRICGFDRIGNTAVAGICSSTTEGGRKVSLFKTLFTNDCNHDCGYCPNATTCTNKKKTAAYDPTELADVFMNLYLRNWVEGLFLSSGVAGDPNTTTERMLATVKLLREHHHFAGYIHFKALPGVSRDLLKEATNYVDRMSVNLEATSKSRLGEISAVKDYHADLVRRQRWIQKLAPPSGQTTQFVVGAAGESDKEVLDAMQWQYKKMGVKRVYYSSFQPVTGTLLEDTAPTHRLRERHLYNVDWLLRHYHFPYDDVKEILSDDGFLPDEDPKTAMAHRFLDGPVDVDHAGFSDLIRVPGIGGISARRILAYRRAGYTRIRRRELKSAGVVVGRAEPFLKINGRIQKSLEAFT